MPATSRSGERFSRRSGSGRAGSPSKSRITQPRSASIVWPRWQSPCVRITRPPTPMCESSCSRSRTSWPRPGSAPAASVVGQVEEDALDLLVDVGGEQRQRLGARLVGRERRVAGVRAERRVQLAGHRRRAREAVEQPLGVGGAARPAPAPSRRARRPGTPAGSPSVASSRRPSTSYQPASGAMCGNPRVGQEAQQLELGVDARLDAPERLQDQLLAEHHRGVRLLDADRAHVDRPAEPGARRLAQRKRNSSSSTGRRALARMRCSSSRPCAGSASAS